MQLLEKGEANLSAWVSSICIDTWAKGLAVAYRILAAVVQSYRTTRKSILLMHIASNKALVRSHIRVPGMVLSSMDWRKLGVVKFETMFNSIIVVR